jgi:hypothetical protein
MPEPAGEVIADGVRRRIRVAALGGEVPQVDLQLRERVQTEHQAAPYVVDPKWRRVATEPVGGADRDET